MNQKKLLTSLASWLIVKSARMLFRTLRREMYIPTPESDPFIPPRNIPNLYAVWHDSMLVPIFAGPQTYMAALVSRHQDGSYLAQSLERLGMLTVRGSSTRGGAAAIRRLMDVTRHRHITITPDGPQGPRRVMKAGMVFLASQTGRAIYPTTYSARRCWRIQGRWTDLMVPKPFSKFYLLIGQPIHVPPDISRDEVRHYVNLVQNAMDELQREADRLAREPARRARHNSTDERQQSPTTNTLPMSDESPTSESSPSTRRAA